MKIKITLIAFFASVLVLTSCMKNEVSPGIEQVRSAYAALLNAQATATITAANAEAAYKNALAAVQTSLAAINAAEAAKKTAEADSLRAKLTSDIAKWAVELDSLKLLYTKQMSDYQAALVAAKNVLAIDYFTKYSNAMDSVRAINNQIFTQQNTILGLSIDIAKGQTLTLDSLNTALASQQAALVTYQANYTAAQAILGNVAAANAKVASLQQDSSTLENTLKTLLADMTTQIRLIDSSSYKSKVTLEATALTNYNNAITAARRDTAAIRFLRDTIANANVPSWWKKALDSVANTQARLAANNTDTTASGTAYRSAMTTIALGTSDIDLAITKAIDSVSKYRDTLLAFIADTVTKNTARLARIADTVQVRTDTATWNAQIKVLHDTLVARRAGGWGDLIIPAADSSYKQAQVDYAVAVRITDTRAAWTASVSALNTSRATWLAQAGAYTVGSTAYNDVWAGTMGVFRENIKVRKTALSASLTARAAAIAAATAALPDLRSNYLYHLTFNVPLQAAVTAALAYKETKRADYETWRDTYYTNTYLVFLDADVQAKLVLYSGTDGTGGAKGATAAAKSALELQAANIELVRLTALKTTATTSLATVKALIPLWKDVTAGQVVFLAQFKSLVDGQVTTIANTQTNITLAKKAYTDKKVLYDQYTIILTSLQAELVVAQAQAAFWLKLLNAAIAAS